MLTAFSVRRHASYDLPVRNGEQFVFVVGCVRTSNVGCVRSHSRCCRFRRFAARPIFSSADIGVDKHKLERLLQPGGDAVATIYGQACEVSVLVM
jgi:hypothetical protein